MVSVITPSIRPEYLNLTQTCLENQTSQDFEWIVEVGLKNRGFTLPADWNKLVSRAKGDIIFILQDCIEIPNDAIEKVSQLAYDETAYTFPVGKRQGDSVAYDWRKYSETATGKDEITPSHWEIDLASAPKELFYRVGGFDERFCKGWSWENVEIAWRAGAAGYTFKVSQATEGIAIDHDAINPHPFRNVRPNNDKRANETRERAARGKFKLDFLH